MARKLQNKKVKPVGASRKIPLIALLLETSREFGRGVIRGVNNYAKAHGPWNFYINPGDIDPVLPSSKLWHFDAIIGRISTQRTLTEALKHKVPIVFLGYGPYRGPIYVRSDSAVVCELAFKYLRERGFSRFAFAGLNTDWGRERSANFGAYATAAGLEFHDFRFSHRSGQTLEQQLCQWLVEIPKPVGLMAQDDLFARATIDMCRFTGVEVPREVAVLGVDNDELICNLSTPTLSSISVNADLLGFEAARALDMLLHASNPGPMVLIKPIGVISRQSTDTIGVSDPVVGAALQFIREHAGEGIGVPDVLRDALVSRRTLELRFEKIVGHAPHEEIERVRLLRARELLISTDMKISVVAQKAGFASVQYMHQIFQRELEMTPGKFRAVNRPFAH
jgi:LacI family transcriptional regulator